MVGDGVEVVLPHPSRKWIMAGGVVADMRFDAVKAVLLVAMFVDFWWASGGQSNFH